MPEDKTHIVFDDDLTELPSTESTADDIPVGKVGAPDKSPAVPTKEQLEYAFGRHNTENTPSALELAMTVPFLGEKTETEDTESVNSESIPTEVVKTLPIQHSENQHVVRQEEVKLPDSPQERAVAIEALARQDVGSSANEGSQLPKEMNPEVTIQRTAYDTAGEKALHELEQEKPASVSPSSDEDVALSRAKAMLSGPTEDPIPDTAPVHTDPAPDILELTKKSQELVHRVSAVEETLPTDKLENIDLAFAEQLEKEPVDVRKTSVPQGKEKITIIDSSKEINDAPIADAEDVVTDVTDEKNTTDELDDVSSTILHDLELFEKQEAPVNVIPLDDSEEEARYAGMTSAAVMRSLFKGETSYEMEAILNRMEEVSKDPTSYVYRTQYAHDNFLTDEQRKKKEILSKAVENAKKKAEPTGEMPHFGNKLKSDGVVYTDVLAKKTSMMEKFKDGQVISNAGSLKAIMLLTQGLKKIYLYSSGFYVVIRAPLLQELVQYQIMCQHVFNTYGRTMGQLAYLPIGVESRTAVVELMHKLIVDSNLQGYQDLTTFKHALSSLDVNTLLWGAATLMFMKGLEVEFLCHGTYEDTGKRCHNVDRAVIDVNKMRYNNWSVLSEQAIKFVLSPKERTLEDLEAYHRDLLHDDDQVVKLTDEFKIHLKIPSYFEYEEASKMYIADMLNIVQNKSRTEMEQYQYSRFFRGVLPYINKIGYTDAETNKTIYFAAAEGLVDTLDTLQLNRTVKLMDVIDDFVAAKQVTYICYTYNKCPKCGHIPETAIDRLIPCDVELTFFLWAVARLQQIM